MIKTDKFEKRILYSGSFFFYIIFSVKIILGISVNADVQKDLPDYLSSLINRALKDKVYKNRYWHTLVHYTPSIRGVVSEIDDPSFFLSAKGRKDPKAELIATLRAFFQEPSANLEHPRCRFIARYHWLKSELTIDEARLPKVECSEYETVVKQLTPQKVVLVFPAAYMNNPASMFGHTLLNIKGKEESSLLSKSVNYSARTSVQSGLIFAFKGVFGLYKGYYEILPYYARIQLYNDINQRDIWEYELNLSPEEIEQMIKHLWELREVYSRYFFFNENCSYNLLHLLEAARPSLNLSRKLKGYVIPLDTIRLIAEANLINTTSYRPSKATKIHHLMDMLPPELNNLAFAMGKLHIQAETILAKNDLSDEDKGHILDLATEYLQYRYVKKEIAQDLYQESFLENLRTRSRIPDSSNSNYDIPEPPSPETGHSTKRLRLGIEFEDGRFYTNLGFRPAYHDLLDPDTGYIEGSEIEFLNMDLRYDPTDEKVELKRLNVLSIIALGSRDLFFKPISWKLQVGVLKARLRDNIRHHEFFMNTGQGLSWKLCKKIRLYAIIETELLVSRNLNPDYSLGIGGTVGILTALNEWWKIHFSGRGLTYEIGDRHNTIGLRLGHQLKLTANTGINFELTRERTFDLYDTLVSLNMNFFF